MKKILTLTVIALVLSAPALGKRSKERSGGFGWFGPTVSFVDFAGLNAELDRIGVGELNSLHWQFGGGGHGHFGRIVIGGSGWGGSQSVSSDSQLVRVDISGGQFEAGYSVLMLKHLVVTPMLGIGGNGYSITSENRNYPGNFQEFLQGPGPTSSIEFSNFSLAPMLDILIPVEFIGVRLCGGYTYTTGTPEWEFPGGGILPGGPDVAAGSPFASLSIAFGSMGSGKRRKK